MSLYLVGTFFFLAANAFALFGVLNPETVKGTLREENIYSAVAPSVLSTASYQEKTAGQLPLEEPWVREAAKNAFPARDLEQKANTAIDGTFAWLEGKTATPEFAIDFTENKRQLAAGIGDHTENRLENLPRCSLNNLPTTFDVFRIECLPPGFNAGALANRVKEEIRTDQSFLQDPVITPKDLGGLINPDGNNAAAEPLAQLEGLRTLFEYKTLLLVLLPLLTAVFAVAGLLLAPDRLKALRRLGRSFLFSAIGLFMFGLLLVFGLKRIIAATATDSLTREVFSPALTGLAAQAQTIYFLFAGGALIVAAAAFIASRKLSAKAN